MPISQLPQAPYRQDRKLFPTPLVGDVLFSEIRDCNRTEFPEYGTAHPNPVKWPHHKLVFIKPVDIERNEIFEFFYAADRENQDLYNFASGTKNIVGNVGGREFRIVQRVYVTLRTAFEPFDIPFGTAMPDIPAGQFDGVDYIFFEKQQAKIEQQELDSLYVAETHTYVEKAILDDKLSYSSAKEDPIPEKFKVQIPQVSTEQIVEGLIQPPTLVIGQLSESQDQLTPDVKLVKKVNRNVTSTSTLSGKVITNELQVGSVAESIVADGTTITPSALTVSGSVETLGNGQSVQRVITVPELFTDAMFTAEKPDLTPSKFKAFYPSVTTQISSVGIAEQPTLTGDELAVSDKQVNAFVKKTQTTSRPAQTEDLTLSGTRAYIEGTEASVTETLSISDQSPDNGYLIIQSEVSAVGDGRSLKETTEVKEWPTLVNAEWDHSIKAQITTSTTFVAPDDASLDQPYVSYKAVNKDRTLRAIENIPTEALNNYFLGLPTKTDLKLPNILGGIIFNYENQSSTGVGSASSYSNTSGESYAVTRRLRSDISGSNSVKGSVSYTINQPWGSDISAMMYYFYIENNSTTNITTEQNVLTRLSSFLNNQTINSWPVFQVQGGTVNVYSSLISSSLTTEASRGESVSSKSYSIEGSSSRSSDKKISQSVDTVSIPSCLYRSRVYSGLARKSVETIAAEHNLIVYSDSPRYRFSNDFSALAGDVITLWPSNHQFICDTNIIDATTFTLDTDGVFTRSGTLNANTVSLTDTKVYVGGVVYGNTVTGQYRFAFNSGISTSSFVNGGVLVLIPSEDSIVIGGDVVDYTNLNGDSNGIKVGAFLEGTIVDKNSTYFCLDPQYVVTGDLSGLVFDGDIITFCDATGTGGSQHTFTVYGSPVFASPYTTIKAKTFDHTTVPIYGVNTHIKINGATASPYPLNSYSVTQNLIFTDSFIEQKPISSSFLGSELYVVDEIPDQLLHTAEASVVHSYSEATATAQISSGSVVSCNITYGGVGYSYAPSIQFSSPELGVTATGAAVITGGVVTGILIGNHGSGYSVAPTITIEAPATTYTDIPRTGLYLVQSTIQPYKWNWLKCMAVVVDMNQFA